MRNRAACRGFWYFVGGNLGITWNELERNRFREGTKMVARRVSFAWIIRTACESVRHGVQDAMQGKMNVGASLITVGGLYTVEYTVMYTVAYTVRTVSGVFERVFTNIYEPKRAENIKRISRYSTCYR